MSVAAVRGLERFARAKRFIPEDEFSSSNNEEQDNHGKRLLLSALDVPGANIVVEVGVEEQGAHGDERQRPEDRIFTICASHLNSPHPRTLGSQAEVPARRLSAIRRERRKSSKSFTLSAARLFRSKRSARAGSADSRRERATWYSWAPGAAAGAARAAR